MSRIDDIRVEIEKIEEAYEFMLAYAAQGRSDEGAGPDGAQIRTLISQFSAAVGIIDRAVSIIPPDLPVAVAFIDQFKSDSATMTSVLAILLNSKNICIWLATANCHFDRMWPSERYSSHSRSDHVV